MDNIKLQNAKETLKDALSGAIYIDSDYIESPIKREELEVAITALEQMQEKEPCKECEAWEESNKIAREKQWPKIANFCPNCGRRLEVSDV